jgi:hypothetical protein
MKQQLFIIIVIAVATASITPRKFTAIFLIILPFLLLFVLTQFIFYIPHKLVIIA